MHYTKAITRVPTTATGTPARLSTWTTAVVVVRSSSLRNDAACQGAIVNVCGIRQVVVSSSPHGP
jgi:hypothetical protein